MHSNFLPVLQNIPDWEIRNFLKFLSRQKEMPLQVAI
jgi:hypothetical protein